MLRVTRGGSAAGLAALVLVALSACSSTPSEKGDAQATTPTTASPESETPADQPAEQPLDDAGQNVPGSSTTTPGALPLPNEGVDVRLADTTLGQVLVDAEGFTLYAYTADDEGMPTCDAVCDDTWPAALVEGDLTVSSSLDEQLFGVVSGANGQQLQAGGWPLYRFAGDGPGDTNGQAAEGMFFALTAEGQLVRSS